MTQVPYPLRMKALGRQGYFQQREEWKVTDILMNPMILMMVLPLLVTFISFLLLFVTFNFKRQYLNKPNHRYPFDSSTTFGIFFNFW